MHAPLNVKKAGLREHHSYPLVSLGKHDNIPFTAFRTPSEHAWHYPSIEIRSGNSFTALQLDIDDGSGYEILWHKILDDIVPIPSWVVTRKHNGHLHAIWTLQRPVLRGSRAREKPLRAFAHASEYIAYVLDADRGYNQVLTHNPSHSAPTFKTTWLHKGGYALNELLSYIPKGWNTPAIPLTAIGRNCTLFETGMKWAGKQANDGIAVLDYIMEANKLFDFPLGYNEVRGIAKSVERYRDQWRQQGWHSNSFIAKQRARARILGKRRREALQERNETIRDLAVQGWRSLDIATHFGLTKRHINRVLQVGHEPTQVDSP